MCSHRFIIFIVLLTVLPLTAADGQVVGFTGLDTDPAGELWALWSEGCLLGAPCPTGHHLTRIDPATGMESATLATSLPTGSTAGPLAQGFAIDPRSGDGGVGCGLVNRPAATLLLPYFEVDLEDPGGRDSLISIGTIAGQKTLAHAVLWTNWGIPVLSFDFFVPSKGVISFRLRDLLAGRIPATSTPPEGTFEGCTDPLVVPAVDTERLAAYMTGQGDGDDGLCRSSAVGNGRLATGYMTVDVVRGCSGAALVTPFDAGYFMESGSGLARNDNVLWGNFYLVDPSNDFAQGENAVAVIADAERFGNEIVCVTEPCPTRITTTFYGSPSPGGDNRMPLARAYQARFLKGGSFTGESELVLWIAGRGEPAACGDTSGPQPELVELGTTFHSERGEPTSNPGFMTPEHALRVTIGGERLPIGERYGSVDLRAFARFPGLSCQGGACPPSEPRQMWAMPLIRAEGRFSVGMTATPIEDFCPVSTP